MHITKPFSDLVAEVGEWSQRNFGEQSGLGEIAPFLGVVEELFVEFLPTMNQDNDLAADAMADTMIFLADLFFRCKAPSKYLSWNGSTTPGSIEEVAESIGALSQVLLKSRQGIRNITNEDVVSSLLRFYEAITDYFACQPGDPLGELTWEVWEKVRQRDWKKNPAGAHLEKNVDRPSQEWLRKMAHAEDECTSVVAGCNDGAASWIPCSDRFPDPEVGVLVTDGHLVTAAELSSHFTKPAWTSHEWGGHEWDFWFDETKITHWMPLPEPPPIERGDE